MTHRVSDSAFEAAFQADKACGVHIGHKAALREALDAAAPVIIDDYLKTAEPVRRRWGRRT